MTDSKITLQTTNSFLDVTDSTSSANGGIRAGALNSITPTSSLRIGSDTTNASISMGSQSHTGNTTIEQDTGTGRIRIFKGASGEEGWFGMDSSNTWITAGPTNILRVGSGRNDGSPMTTGDIEIGTGLTSGAMKIATGTSRSASITVGDPSSTGSITIDAGSAEVNVRGANGLRADDGISFDGGTNTISTYVAKNFFTPALGSPTVNFTMTTQRGRYTRIGALVVFHVHIVWTSHNSATAGDNLILKTLPIVQDSDSQYEATFTLGACDAFNGLASNAYPAVNGILNTTTADFTINDTNTGSSTNITVGDTNTSGFIRISGSYIAN